MSSHRIPFLLNAIEEALRTIGSRPTMPNAPKFLREAAQLRATVESWRRAPPDRAFQEGVMQRVLRLHTEAARMARASTRPPGSQLAPFSPSPSVRPIMHADEAARIRVPPPPAVTPLQSPLPFSKEPTPPPIPNGLASSKADLPHVPHQAIDEQEPAPLESGRAPSPLYHDHLLHLFSPGGRESNPQQSSSLQSSPPQSSRSQPNQSESIPAQLSPMQAGRSQLSPRESSQAQLSPPSTGRSRSAAWLALLVLASSAALLIGVWAVRRQRVQRGQPNGETAMTNAVTQWAPPDTSALPPAPSISSSAPATPSGNALPTVPDKAPAPGVFDREAALAALDVASAHLDQCKLSKASHGQARVTFAAAGNVASVKPLPPYAGTRPGACVGTHLKQARVAPFRGPAASLVYSFGASSR